MYGITSQIRRAGVSIPANIAEGQARNTKGEFLQFLGVAQGSLAELETLLEISKDLGYLSSPDVKVAGEVRRNWEAIGGPEEITVVTQDPKPETQNWELTYGIRTAG